jgi:polysaccharide export outer membrane protein
MLLRSKKGWQASSADFPHNSNGTTMMNARSVFGPLRRALLSLLLVMMSLLWGAQNVSAQGVDYQLGPGDVVRFQVFQQPDLSIEARLAEGGTISYPLIGLVKLGGLTVTQAEQLVAQRLKSGNFLQNPQVTINVMQFRSAQVSVLGFVNRPGRYPLEQNTMRLTEVLAMAGGIIPNGGADTVIVVSEQSGRSTRTEIDVIELFASSDRSRDIALKGGDSVFVNRAPVFFIYGQVQRPGSFPLDRNMTMAQAIAKGGGVTLRGTEKNFRVQRRDASGAVSWIDGSKLEDAVRADDLIFIRESLF